MAGPESSENVVKMGILESVGVWRVPACGTRLNEYYRRAPTGDPAPPGPICGPPAPGIPVFSPGGPLVLGIKTGWSRGTSRGAVYIFSGGVTSSSEVVCRISRFGVEVQPIALTKPMAAKSQTPRMSNPPQVPE